MGATRYATRSTTQSVSGFLHFTSSAKVSICLFRTRRLKQTVWARVKDAHIFPFLPTHKKTFQTAFQCRQIRIIARSINWVVTVTRKAKFIFLLLCSAQGTRRQFRRVWRTFQWQQRVRGAKSSSSRCCRSSIFELARG
jgi:hypothetical protein